ncbi:hypothetical protein [Microbacterium sorbitolivorans]|uniref:Uncharacterized protein n=1 Tax=Microbacterium sorbitolivorans TaxID=1867410 RepID=A0A367Y3A5_9MICO|nr:hypothetical protein [Microbacterium sorbitolivorans]RCK60089.1 hypothetical protein DTO57_08125 [Microbacterium sorbitolivorans]
MAETSQQFRQGKSSWRERWGDWGAASSLMAIALLLVSTLMYILPVDLGMPLVSAESWVIIDPGYLVLMGSLVAFLLCHASLISPSRSPQVLLWVSVVFGVFALILSFATTSISMVVANTDWRIAASWSRLIIYILPFGMTFAAGWLLVKLRHSSTRVRLVGVGICVVVTTLLVAIVAFAPSLAGDNVYDVI